MDIAEDIRNRLVLGTAGLAGIWGKVDRKESIRAVHMALEMGIDHFDTAPAYADAEALLGEALSAWSGPAPFISTKVGKLKADNPDALMLDYSREGIRRSIENSLQSLKRDTLDLVFLHDPVYISADQIAPAIEELSLLRTQGKIKSVGIGGNFESTFMPFATSGSFSHFMGFNRYNILVQEANEEEFIPLRNAGVEIWQASPLYMGLLGKKYKSYLLEKPEWIPGKVLSDVMVLQERCERNKVDMTGLALNFVMRSKDVNRMVIGASSSVELQQTIDYLHDTSLCEMADNLLSNNPTIL